MKFSILYKDTWATSACLSISVQNRHFCLFLSCELFNNIAIKNMNVMDVIKAWFALISASGTTVAEIGLLPRLR